MNLINIPYGYCLLPSNSKNRQGAPGPDVFGNGKDYTECVPQIIKTPEVIGPQNTNSVNNLNNFFFNNNIGAKGYSPKEEFSGIDLQSVRPIAPNKNYYIQLGAKSLNANPDLLISVFFSDDNINHLRQTIVARVKRITGDSGIAGSPDGVTIKTPNMDDLFYYMVNIYQTYKVHNGSICFINLQKNNSIKSEITKLNTDLLQEYVSKMVSQINMYIYYYKDASQLPEQMSRPTYTAMKGSKSLEYNTGFQSGNSIGIASYNQVGNII